MKTMIRNLHFTVKSAQCFVFCVGCLFILSCSSQQKMELPEVSSGDIERYPDFQSQYVVPRSIDVWVPETYDKKKQHAVLYMHDGQMLFDSTRSWNKQEWMVDEVMTKLSKQDVIPTIVVAIHNTTFRHSEYFPQKPFESLAQEIRDSIYQDGGKENDQALFKKPICSDDYLRFIVKELKPFIDKTYSTYPNVDHTFIAGSSMGGLISMYALAEYPEIFKKAACLSTHWIGVFDTLNNPIPDAFATYMNEKLPNLKDRYFYFDYGTETLDALYEPFQLRMDRMAKQHGFTMTHWKSLKFPGADHSERAWAARLDYPFHFLMDKNLSVDGPALINENNR